LAKTRQPLDGPVWVRTYPVTFLHDVTESDHDHAWHQLTFATRGHLEVITDDARHIVPADRAVWVPAGTPHTEVMRAPISMRSIYVSRLALPSSGNHAGRTAPDRVRTIRVAPLLRELILHISRIGALDRRKPEQARLVGVLLDQLAAAPDEGLALRAPRDPRARRLAELIMRELGGPPMSNDLQPPVSPRAQPPAARSARSNAASSTVPRDDATSSTISGRTRGVTSIGALARKAGASLRTLERCFVAETGASVGEWRRRVRLFHALRLLEGGAAVTTVALDVGYASTSAFSHAFARQFGQPPSRRVQPR
jgi:AraC-like DNA-binding protein